MNTYQWVECLAGFEESIKAYGVHVTTKALWHALSNVEGDAKHGIDGFEGTLEHELMLKQVEVLKDAFSKIERLRSA